jgi:hypothetical protein
MRYSFIFWTLPFSTAASFSPLVLQIIASTFHTDIGEGPNTRGRMGASTSDHKTKNTNPIHEQTKKT